MRRHRRPRHGDGTAWLVADRARGDYLCYWYTGTGDAHLVEHARAASAEDAIAWGRDRTPRVRIRTAEARSYWAGTIPTPEGFAHTWTQSDTVSVVPPPCAEAPPSSPGPATEFAGPAPAVPSRITQLQPPDPRPLVGAGQAPSGGSPC